MVRAKFHVTEITRHMGSRQVDGKWVPAELQTVKFSVVSGGSDENKAFWDASPSGNITLGVINQEAWHLFELGKEYYVNFSPAQ